MFKKISEKIPAHAALLIRLLLVNLVVFFIFRIVFYYQNRGADSVEITFYEKFLAFKTGLEFDLSVLCPIAGIPLILWTLASCKKSFHWLFKTGFFAFQFLIILYYLVCSANIPYYHQFGNHLNAGAFLWNDNPGFVLSMILESFSYWGYFLLFILLSAISLIISLRYFRKFKTGGAFTSGSNIWRILASVVMMVLLVMGARGRITDRTGLHEGHSIVSQNPFINQVAINPNFIFWKNLVEAANAKPYKAPEDIDDKIKFTRNYLGIDTPFEPNIARKIKQSRGQRCNFIIVVMESMSVFKMGYYRGKNLTPELNRIAKESVFFNNFFTSGIHTFNGLFSINSGFPGILTEKSMNSYVKKSFNGLGPLLKQQGYENYFYTTHDPHFDNMAGFYKLNKFDHFISQHDFDLSQSEGSLGVPDHVLFDKLLETNRARSKESPFAAVLMTASDHGPWRIPANTTFVPTGSSKEENCTLYADWAIGRFIEMAKKEPWFDNTVFIFLGDHGLSMGHTYEMPLSYNHVPLIIYQPAIFAADTIVYPAYQPDIPATVMGIIGAEYTNESFGLNILKQKHPFVVFSADDKIGCVDSNGYFFYRTLSNQKKYLRKYKDLDPVNYAAKLPARADSMNNGMMKIYETAHFIIRRDYYLND